MITNCYSIMEAVRRQSPVVHHLTNWVTIYDCAQVVKVLGASPVMAHAKEEVEEMARLAAALVLNIGTLTVEMVEAMKLAAKSANGKGIPVTGISPMTMPTLTAIWKVNTATTPMIIKAPGRSAAV